MSNLSETWKALAVLYKSGMDFVEKTARLSEQGYFENVVKHFYRLQNAVQKAFVVPDDSEVKHEHEHRLASFEKWGEYGWTVLPHAEFCLFYESPCSREDADVIISTYCTNEQVMKFLDSMIVDPQFVQYFNEAKYDFSNERYVSCAMCLMAILNGSLHDQSNIQSINFTTLNKISTQLSIDQKRALGINLFEYKFANLLSCLCVRFDNAENFTREFHCINRNYLMHGMISKQNITIDRTDCIQLIFIVYNYQHLFNDLTMIGEKLRSISEKR